jgi:glyoxylase-like metal-dependent hydrolase (beta-lactamase superfamily II)
MKIEFMRLTLGPLPNNVYILFDQDNHDAVVIDPSFNSHVVLNQTQEKNLVLNQIWLTHGHFDHIAGAAEIAEAFEPPLPIGLHPADQDWYEDEGGAGRFGMSIPRAPAPTLNFEHGMVLSLSGDGPPVVTVRHAPGHSAGHVMFYCEPLGVLFCGDVIFREGIGRTDLQGGSMETLLSSIEQQVLSLPDDTRLLPGHGPETTVGHERALNPYLSRI